ncbi:hypothetical protein H920_18197 [Fukomys damarensis]|uniref:Uncharacterized protein n=1 Tax=Fukomys damarensis TaxID=885580 RepID=A0A091DC73_FUKDA|nr:hypothetical protein H920_18197 [Fukomys damarensis]
MAALALRLFRAVRSEWDGYRSDLKSCCHCGVTQCPRCVILAGPKQAVTGSNSYRLSDRGFLEAQRARAGTSPGRGRTNPSEPSSLPSGCCTVVEGEG